MFMCINAILRPSVLRYDDELSASTDAHEDIVTIKEREGGKEASKEGRKDALLAGMRLTHASTHLTTVVKVATSVNIHGRDLRSCGGIKGKFE